MEEPTLTSYGLTSANYERWKYFEEHGTRHLLAWPLAIGFLIGVGTGFRSEGLTLATPLAILIYGGLGFGYTLLPLLVLYAIMQPVLGVVVPSFGRYRAFVAAQQGYQAWKRRTIVDYWQSLSGTAFEREMAALFVREGFQAELTPTQGDKGIDIELRKEGRRIIVQCKATAKPVGPGVARELYGTLVASGADEAVLATTGGVTAATREFIEGKPIRVMTIEDIVAFYTRRTA